MNQEPLEQQAGEQRIYSDKTLLEGQIGQSHDDVAQQQQINKNSPTNTISVSTIIQNDNNKALIFISLTVVVMVGVGSVYMFYKSPEVKHPREGSEVAVQDKNKNLMAREIIQNFEILNSRLDLLYKHVNQSSKNPELHKILNQSPINLPGFCHDYYYTSIDSLDVKMKKELDIFYQTIDIIQTRSDKLIIQINNNALDTTQNGHLKDKIDAIKELSKAAHQLGIGVINKSGVSFEELELELEGEYNHLGSNRMICSLEAKVFTIKRLKQLESLYESYEKGIVSERKDLENLIIRILHTL